jgi:predicted nucleic acid-binding protein
VIHHPHEPLLPVMWRLRPNLTAYDAAYVAVAEVLDRPLVTLDATLARSPGHGAVVDLVAPAVAPASVR